MKRYQGLGTVATYILFLSLTLLFVIPLSSCTSKKKFKVGFLHPSESRKRFVNEGRFMAAQVRELGGEAIVKGANDDEKLQLEQGYQLLEEGVSTLVICPINTNTIAPLVRAAQKQGVDVIAYIRIVNNATFTAFLATDNEYMASVWVESALRLSPKGNYVIIGGDRFDENAVLEMNAIERLLTPHVETGKVNIVFKGYTDGWNKGLAAYHIEKVANAYGDKIDAIISCNDEMADGAISVLKEMGLEGKVPVTGQDADLVGARNVVKGYQTVTFFHPSKELGVQAANLAFALYQGKRASAITPDRTFNGVAEIPTIKVQSVSITKDNVDVLIQNGLYKKGEIYE